MIVIIVGVVMMVVPLTALMNWAHAARWIDHAERRNIAAEPCAPLQMMLCIMS